MPIEQRDVPVQPETILREVQERTQPTYQFREAFRDFDASDQDAEELKFPVPDDDLEGHVVEIDEGSDFPRSELNYSEVSAVRQKYGFEVVITDEAVRFGRVDIEMESQEEMARAATKNLDQRAFNLLDSNNNDTVVGNDGEDLDFEAVVEAYEVLNAGEYNPEMMGLMVGSDGLRDLSLDDSFNRATDLGDNLVTDQGPEVVGEVYGTPVLRTNTGDFGDDEAFMVDMSKYGYLAEWEPMSVNTYREESNQQTVYQISGHNGFAVTDADACVKLQGGASGA
jgi:HK97 family phage major capsid protein